jgi:hypothetical protein
MRKALALGFLCGLAACGDLSTKVQSAAESTRSATERFAANASASDRSRVARISEDAQPLGQAEAIALGERYYMRAEANGWTVIDRLSNAPATIGEEPTERLSLEAAEKLVVELREADPSR